MENPKGFFISKLVFFCVVLLSLAGFGGCGGNKSKNVVGGALVGGLLGGGIGAALASTSTCTAAGAATAAATTTSTSVAAGAAVGAGVGAAGGGMIGAAMTDECADNKEVKSPKKAAKSARCCKK